MTDPGPHSSGDNPTCAGCGYNLTGLPPRGMCPECGAEFFAGGPVGLFTPRPPFGCGLLIIPPLVTGAWIPLALLWPSALAPCSLIAMPFVLMALIYNIAERLANWRHTVAIENGPPGTAPPNRESFVRRRFALYFVLQLAGCGLALLACQKVFGWLIAIGVLRPLSFS